MTTLIKAYEMTLVTGEVIYTQDTQHLTEMLTEIGGKFRLTITKTLFAEGLHAHKLGKKFTAKFEDGTAAEIRIVEHDFAPVVERAAKSTKVKIGKGDWLERLTASLASAVNVGVGLSVKASSSRFSLVNGSKVLAWSKEEGYMVQLLNSLNSEVLSTSL